MIIMKGNKHNANATKNAHDNDDDDNNDVDDPALKKGFRVMFVMQPTGALLDVCGN